MERRAGQTRVLQLNGKLQEDERERSSLVAHVGGRVEKLYVTFTGEQVRQGQALATLYAPEVLNAQRELLEAMKLNDGGLLAEAARQKLRYWKFPEALIDSVARSGRLWEEVVIRADAAGVVRERRVAQGDYVREGEVLFDLANLQRLWVMLDVYEEDLALVNRGDMVTFRVPAIPGRSFRARVAFIDPVVDPRRRIVRVRAEVDNSGGLLKPEMLVRAELTHTDPREAMQVLVPKTAVMWTGPRSVVYVKVPNQTAPSFQFREVTLEGSAGNYYIVSSGLQAGEEVVTKGGFVIDAAAQLNNQASMMNRRVLVEGQEAADALDYRDAVNGVFREQLDQLLEAYVGIKDAFVQTDAVGAAAAAKKMVALLAGIDPTLLSGPPFEYWRQQSGALKAHLQKIAGSVAVEAQREQFDFLSRLMIDLAATFGSGGKQLYVQHCPMAFNDQGADWLSYEDRIRNPYFGDVMLSCGIVQDSIQ